MFYERIKALRLSLGLNQVQFGNKLGVTKQCISNWENSNMQPSIDMLIHICRTFHVSADHLLGLDDRKMLDVSGLEQEQVSHLRFIVCDILGE